jgi:UDP-glucose 4-epimerase
VNALIAAAESSLSNKIYNVGSDTTISINKIVEILGGDKINIPKRPGEPDCTYADISSIKRDLGWKPSVSIEDGVREILKDIDYWKDATVWDSESIADATSDWFKYLDK